MRILIAAPTYLPSPRANTLQVLKMAQAVDALGHEIVILVPDPDGGLDRSWSEIAAFYGLQRELDIKWIPINSLYRGYDYAVKVIRFFRELDGDILYTRSPQAAALASNLNIAAIFEVHDLPGGVMGPWLLRRFLGGSGAQRIVLITEALDAAVEQKFGPYPQNLSRVVAPDGVDLIRYRNLPDVKSARQVLRTTYDVHVREDQFTVGYTGHLYRGRGIDLILGVAARMPGFTFLLVGGNPGDIEALLQDVKDHSLQNVIITGFIPNADLPLYQAACDVLVMPYQEEVAASSGGNIARFLSPMKMFEYLACGRVIVSSDLPVLREILNDQVSILLPPADINAWVDTLKEIQGDPDRRVLLSANAKNIASKYTWNARAEAIFPQERSV